MNKEQFSLERLRADVAEILHEDDQEISFDDDLIEFGLDSLRAMTLISRWSEQGAAITFEQAAQQPTIRQWHRLINQSE